MAQLFKAIKFAMAAHKGQKRKYTGDGYIQHPLSVAEIVVSVSSSDEALCAAVLHDTVEDTATTIENIKSEFGCVVARLVDELTDISKPEDGNRAKRKQIDLIHLSKASDSAKTIKLADLIDNSKSIIEHDKDFARVYMKEKRALLEVLTGGSDILHEKATQIVNNYFNGSK